MSLIKWKDTRFQLANRVSHRWERFGLALSIPQGLTVGWDSQYRGDAVKCWMKVMGHWLSEGGTSEYPTTWAGVYELLKDMEFEVVANELEELVKQWDKK